MATESARPDRWLETLVHRRASDLFLVVGLPAAIRVTGGIEHLEEASLGASDIETAILTALSPQTAQKYPESVVLAGRA
jgi:Tfp pilus assembly ATPase PilU